ncbi:MAG: FMN-binding protein [Planctomycetes bacterium]|nr:FMN-binding protein [Planctomycetota bacterium]
MIRYMQQGWLVLLLGLVCGLALAGVDTWLGPQIANNQRLARQKAAAEVLGGTKAELITVNDAEVFEVTDKDGRLVGWAVPASGPGYGDTIRLIVGIAADGSRLTDFQVIYNQETPGLGNKIVEPAFRGRFKDKDPSVPLKAVQKPQADDEIQALTGATISSQAVADIIYKQLNETGLLDTLRGQAGGGTSAVRDGGPSATTKASAEH